MSDTYTPGHLVIQEWNKDQSQPDSNRIFTLDGCPADQPIQTIDISPGTDFPLQPPREALRNFALTVYHLNDLHGHVVRFSPEGDLPVLSRLAGELRRNREEIQDQPDQGVLILSAGDDCAGSIFDELSFSTSHDLPTHPCYHLYSKIGVDAVGLGNHDFDQGLERLLLAVQNYAGFPVLAANLKYDSSFPRVIYPGAIALVNQLRVGLIGLVTRAETRLKPEQGEIVDPLPIAQNLVDVIRPYCDLMIIISHLGYCLDHRQVPMADAGDVQLAQSLPYGSVNLLVGGHSHTALNVDGFNQTNLVNGIPIVQAGQEGSYLGRVSIQIQEGEIEIAQAELLSTEQLPDEKEFYNQEIKPVVDWARDLLSHEIGRIDPILQISAEEVRSRFAAGEMGLANFLCDALYDRLRDLGHEIDFTMLDLSAVHCGFPHRDLISFGDCFEMMPFTDTVRLYSMTGTQLVQLIQDNTRRLGSAGETAEERGFLQFSKQIRYSIEADFDNGEHVAKEIEFQGKSLEVFDDHTFCIGTTCFTRVLAASWEETIDPEALLLERYPYLDTDIILRHEIVSFVRDLGNNSGEGSRILDGRLKIIDMP